MSVVDIDEIVGEYATLRRCTEWLNGIHTFTRTCTVEITRK